MVLIRCYSGDRLQSAERRVNFEGLSDSANGFGEALTGRGGDRLLSAARTSERHAVSPASHNEVSHQQAETSVAPRSLLLYSRPREHLPMSDDLHNAVLSVSPTRLPDGARLMPFSVNSLRFTPCSYIFLLFWLCIAPHPAPCSPVNVVRNLSASASRSPLKASPGSNTASPASEGGR